jgi:hypothetical protein
MYTVYSWIKLIFILWQMENKYIYLYFSQFYYNVNSSLPLVL